MFLPDDDAVLARYSIGDDERLVGAITAAFQHADVDPYERGTTLDDWVDCDTLGELSWDSNEALRLSTEVWGHPTAITADAVTVYAPTDG
ncbi:MAG: hypothetical protein ACQERM_05490 [Methanobacteriota archaeon]